MKLFKSMPNLMALLALAFAALVVGCQSSDQSSSPATPSSTQPTASGTSASAAKCAHAECLVCKKNADLACIDVEVEKTTPTYVYNGRTHYFCSEECRDKFAKNPQKYLEK
jgi:YHS domain-containing protein